MLKIKVIKDKTLMSVKGQKNCSVPGDYVPNYSNSGDCLDGCAKVGTSRYYKSKQY